MNIKLIFFVLLSLVFGAGAAVFASNWLQQQAGGQAVVSEGPELSPVVVAARDIDFGSPIEDVDIKIVLWPASGLPEGVIMDAETVVGKIPNTKIVKGEPLMEQKLVSKLGGSTLSSLIAPNMRAITVRVNDVAGVAGFLLPGNRVDVLGTRMVDRRAVSRTVLQNIKVLAVDQTANPDKDEPVVVRAVTLEASPDDSLELVKATQEGSVQLVLRNPEDLATRIAAPAKVAAAPPPQRVRREEPKVRIIRGTSVNELSVR